MESGWASNKNWQSQVCLYIIHPIINDQKISLALCYVGVASEQIVFNPVLPASPYTNINRPNVVAAFLLSLKPTVCLS